MGEQSSSGEIKIDKQIDLLEESKATENDQ